MRNSLALLALLTAAAPAIAQQKTDPAFEAMLKGTLMNTYKLNGTCKALITPEGDLTKDCDPELINMAFPSGNSSFIATIKDKGSISFRGKDSPAVGDIATLKVSTILLTGTTASDAVALKAKGKCTYTNPNVGPVQVECEASTDRGTYRLSYTSDGVWPPK
jgi:hypothetical protein